MKTTGNEQLIDEKQRLAALCEAFHEMGETEEENKLSDLLLKIADEEFAIAFCGHFSAGKSSLINTISSTGILPASPIPTSANVVKMKKGAPKAIIHLKNKDVVTFPYPYDIEEIKNLCKNGTLVSAIEIFYEPKSEIANISFYDTPGIDSTDPAHKEATENVVYLADLIFYVMDYNHIFSETNISFIKDLQEKGKSVRLIVNQIDKHNEEELSFQEFKEKVFDGFSPYGIEKEQIFFTSVKKPSFAYNDLQALTAYLQKIEWNKESLLIKETNRQLDHFVNDYIQRQEREIKNVQTINDQLESLTKEKISLNSEQATLNEKIREREESIKNGFHQIIDSAQLMPYETRERAGQFIDSARKDFKVGLFFSKQKTEQEKLSRKEAFREKLQESIDAQVNWHAINYVNELEKDLRWDLPEWKSITMEEETLYAGIQSGLSSEGQGLLNYCESIAGQIKKTARQQMNGIIHALITKLKDETETTSHETSKRIETLNEEIRLLELEQQKANVWYAQKGKLLNILSTDSNKTFSVEEYVRKYSSKFNPISLSQFKEIIELEKLDSEPSSPGNLNETSNPDDLPLGSIVQEAIKLKNTANLLKPLANMKYLVDEMEDLATRLENRSFTMVLFGAFSAGKSSFANALFGEHILPSSPNPTTAAINEIRRPDQTHAHGEVMIEMKTEEDILSEIKNITQSDAGRLDEVLQSAAAEKHSGKPDSKKNHLQAFIEGYENAKAYVGRTLKTKLSEVEKYAAVEKNACYVKKITIYYSCPLTEKGLVLVDTPGANSIHSRHTEVAFEYMKHADVILYVTYFNHAFSYADREFLIQLGRIKDTFSSDKMFFAINASDLAESEEDKNAVVDHVKSNLQSFGIRNPRLYAVSSKNQLVKEKSSSSGFTPFTENLYKYVEHDLEQAMVRSADSLQSHVKKLIQNLISESEKRLQKEDNYLNEIEKREQGLLDACQKTISLSLNQLNQEMKELLFYIKQRVLIRYHDFFKETIHPAAVQSKPELMESLEELYKKIAHDLNQEYRACSLRLDKWIQKSSMEKETEFLKLAGDKNVNLKPAAIDQDLFDTPEIPIHFEQSAKIDQKKWPASFKNPKQFFEEGGAAEMRNELAKVMESEIEEWIVSVKPVLEDHYDGVIKEVQDKTAEQLRIQIVQYFTELKKPGDLKGRIETLKKYLSDLDQLSS